MQLLPNGNYQITNTKTGEVREVSPNNLSKYGLSVPTPQPTSTPQSTGTAGYKSTTQGIAGLLKSFGLQAIPNIAGAGYEVYRAAAQAAGKKNVYYNPETGETVQNPFLKEEDLSRIAKKPVETIARQTAGLASYGIPGGVGLAGKAATGAVRGAALVGGIPETSIGEIAAGAAGGAVLEPAASFIGKFLKHPTFTKIGKQTQSAVEEATQRGITKNYNDVLQTAYKSDFAGTTQNKRLIAKVWSEFAPSEAGGAITPADLYKARNTISATYGDILYGKAGQSTMSLAGNAKVKAAEVVRRAISKELQSAVPEVAELDKIVQLYNKGGVLKGDLVQKAQKALIGYFTAKYGKSALQTLFYTR